MTTRIGGLETFTNTPTDATYGPDGNLNGIVGIATDFLLLTLYAEDEVGNMNQQTLEIPVINPECVPAGNAVTLYAGPDVRHQVVSTVTAGAFVVVDARDTSGNWVRVQLPGGLHGWGQVSEFTCAQNFAVSNLYTEVVVPTVPPPTITPTATATFPPPTATPTPSQTAHPVTTPTTTATASG